MQTDTSIRVHIRWAIRLDVPDVTVLERSVGGMTEEQYLAVMRGRNVIGMVAELESKVVGHVVYELQDDKLNVLTLVVQPKLRRQGIGTQIMDRLLAKLSAHRRCTLRVLLRESNLTGQLFLRAQGLCAIEVLRGHYADTGEDAYVMVYIKE